MFNLQPGTGLGTTPSKEIAFGLGAVIAAEAVVRVLATFVALSIKTGFTATNKTTGFIADSIKTYFETNTPE